MRQNKGKIIFFQQKKLLKNKERNNSIIKVRQKSGRIPRQKKSSGFFYTWNEGISPSSNLMTLRHPLFICGLQTLWILQHLSICYLQPAAVGKENAACLTAVLIQRLSHCPRPCDHLLEVSAHNIRQSGLIKIHSKNILHAKHRSHCILHTLLLSQPDLLRIGTEGFQKGIAAQLHLFPCIVYAHQIPEPCSKHQRDHLQILHIQSL